MRDKQDNIVPISKKVKGTLPPGTVQQRPYAAFSVSERERGEYGLVLYYEDGETDEVLYYAYLMRAVSEGDDVVLLLCTDCVYTLWGQNLRSLLPLLSDHKIRSLCAFNPQKHLPLAEGSDEMLIQGITMQSNAEWWRDYDERQKARDKAE